MGLLSALNLPPSKEMLRTGVVAPVEAEKDDNPSILGAPGASAVAAGVGKPPKGDLPAQAPRKAPPAAADDPARAAAQAVRKQLEARVEKARDAHRAIAQRIQDLARKAAAAKNPDDKAGIDKLRKQWEKSLDTVGKQMDLAREDVQALDSKSATREDLQRALKNAQSVATIDAATETALKAGGDAFNESVDRKVTTKYANGEAEVKTDEVAWTLDGDGARREELHEKKVLGPGGASSTVSEKKTQSLGAEGFKQETVRKAEITEVKNGQAKTRSLETTDTLTANAGELSQERTVKQTKADGSAKSTTSKVGAHRGDGQAGVSGSKQKELTDADGNTNTGKASGTGSLIADGKSGGAAGEGNLGAGRKQENGASLAGNLKIHGKVKCTIGDADDNTGLYPVTVEVSCGAEVSIEGGKENEKAGRKIGFQVSYGAEYVFRETHSMSGEELGRYEKAMKAAASGKIIDKTWKEVEVLATGLSQGWAAAQRVAKGEGPLSKEALAALRNVGDSTELESSDAMAGGVAADAKYVQASIKKERQTSKSTKATLKKGNQLGIETMQTQQDKLSGSLGGGFGVVGGAFGGSETVKTGFGFDITVDRAKDADGKLVAAFAKCRTRADYEKLIAANKDRVTLESVTDLKAQASTSNVQMTLGGAKAQIGTGSGLAEQVKKGADGKVIAATTVGEQQAGGGIGAGDFSFGDSAQNKAVATQDGDDTSLVLERQKNQSSLGRMWGAALSAVGLGDDDKPDAQGALSKATGAGEKADLEIHDVSGIRLTKKDLAAIAARALKDDWDAPGGSNKKDYDAWRAARGEVVAAKGDPAAVAHALSRFVGTSSKDRLALLRRFLRPGGKVAIGMEYAFPDALRSYQKDFERYVVKEGELEVEALAGKKGTDEALKLAGQIRMKLLEMRNQISGSTDFADRSAQADMVSHIAERRTALDAVMRRLRGAVGAEDELNAKKEEWDVRVGSCRVAKKAFDAMCEELEKHFPSRGRMLSRDALELSPRFNKLFDTKALLLRELAAADALADAHGFDKKRYAEARPDEARVKRIVDVYGLTPP